MIQKFEMKFYVTALPGGILAKQIVKTDFIILRENFILRNLLHFHFFSVIGGSTIAYLRNYCANNVYQLRSRKCIRQLQQDILVIGFPGV